MAKRENQTGQAVRSSRKMITFSLSSDEYQQIERAAHDDDRTMSSFVRRIVRRSISETPPSGLNV